MGIVEYLCVNICLNFQKKWSDKPIYFTKQFNLQININVSIEYKEAAVQNLKLLKLG